MDTQITLPTLSVGSFVLCDEKVTLGGVKILSRMPLRKAACRDDNAGTQLHTRKLSTLSKPPVASRCNCINVMSIADEFPLFSHFSLSTTTPFKPRVRPSLVSRLDLANNHMYENLQHAMADQDRCDVNSMSIASSPTESTPVINEPPCAPEGSWKTRKRWWPFVIAPYFVGLVWTSLHPVVSVITGEPKCRGWFIDESALDPSGFQMEISYPVPQIGSSGASSLCDVLGDGKSPDSVSCFHHEKGQFDVARVVPVSNAVEPTAEVVVMVVPAPSKHWNSSELHISLLHLLDRLADSKATPWLAKTVLFVSPSTSEIPLQTTVSSFLDSYLGTSARGSVPMTRLPPSFTSGMIRNLLVLDLIVDEGGDRLNELRILPQGRRGVLPNMDFVFAAMMLSSRASFMDSRQRASLVMHPYGSQFLQWREWVNENLPPSLLEWANDLGNMVLFAYSLVVGPYPPHASVLDRGIDAITIQGRFIGQSRRVLAPFVSDYVQKLEYFLHALSNLHERLHHSITQYLLPSPTKFVSHSEYLVPNILLLLPLAMRAALLALLQIERFHVRSIQIAILAVLCVIPLYVASEYVGAPIVNALYAMVYAIVFAMVRRDATSADEKDARLSIHFVACLLAVYTHVPITLAHVSLSYPSAIFWTPLLAFPSYSGKTGLLSRCIVGTVLFVTWPPFALVPRVFYVYTPYVFFVYTPLHILASLLWLG